ncbi:MAG: C39 family peptidase [Patescibacteria group bacterium]|nr:C39 family peptidase [Patescibacteria group bacterium]
MKNCYKSTTLNWFCQVIWLILFLAIFIFPLTANGGLVDEFNRRILEHENERAELERKAAEYQSVINQKKGEIKSLRNQIYIFNARIGKLETEMEITEDDINLTKLEIIQLEYGIGQTKNDIAKQKDNISEIIQSIAEQDQVSQLEMILQSDDFSDFYNQIVYLENLQNGVQEKVVQLKLLKDNLNENKENKEDKKKRLEGLKKQLAKQKWSLNGQKKSKEALLTHTRGEESKYQQMLANIEAQKKSLLGDINRLRRQKAAELARLKELQEKPPAQYWASLNWYYKQDDARWANTTIGISGSSLGDYGCAITSVAMVLTENGVSVTPKQLAKESIYDWDLIRWPSKWRSVACTNCPPPHTSSFDWFRLDRELGAGNPVIIFVKAIAKNAGHYVVVHHKTNDGRYVVHDPLFGANIYLDSTRVYLSYLYGMTTIDQMVIYH